MSPTLHLPGAFASAELEARRADYAADVAPRRDPAEGLTPIHAFADVTITPPAPDPGARGELRWIPLAYLYVDPLDDVHLASKSKCIKGMAGRFAWPRFTPVIVVERGPQCFVVIDGRRRSIAALVHGGVHSVPCLVHPEAAKP
jgi:hypothetical protein